jgi:tRNA(adenine34) deaminase
MSSDTKWMKHALALAARAEEEGEVPVGAVLIKDDQIIGEGWNQPISHNDPTAHAEIQAIRDACQKLNNYRLPGTTLYLTLEPCIMCAGAIVHARISRIVIAANEPKSGAAGSCINIFDIEQLNHKVIVDNGLLTEQSSDLLKNFFKLRRKKRNNDDL